MKNPITLVFFIIISCFSVKAQEETPALFNKNWRVLFQVNGPSAWQGQVNFIKPISTRLYARVSVSPTISFSKNNNSPVDLEDYSVYKNQNKTFLYGANLGLGLEYHLIKDIKLDPYLGGGFSFGYSKTSSKGEIMYELIEDSNLRPMKYEGTSNISRAPSFDISPFLLAGVNYYFNPRFGLGVEYSLLNQINLTKGKNKQEEFTKATYSDGSVIENSFNNEIKINQSNFNLNHKIGFHFILILNKSKKEGK